MTWKFLDKIFSTCNFFSILVCYLNFQIKLKLITQEHKEIYFKIIVVNVDFARWFSVENFTFSFSIHSKGGCTYLTSVYFCKNERNTKTTDAFTKFGDFCSSRKKGRFWSKRSATELKAGESQPRLLYTVASSTVVQGGVAEQRHPPTRTCVNDSELRVNENNRRRCDLIGNLL